jgi:hypothetical protein
VLRLRARIVTVRNPISTRGQGARFASNMRLAMSGLYLALEQPRRPSPS